MILSYDFTNALLTYPLIQVDYYWQCHTSRLISLSQIQVKPKNPDNFVLWCMYIM